MGLRRRIAAIPCRFGWHRPEGVNSYHIDLNGHTHIVGRRLRCFRCNTDLGWIK
jgi:hypothetical protein